MHLFHRLHGVLPISQYLLKRYAEEVSNDPELVLGELVFMLYAEVYQVQLHEEDLSAVCARITGYGEKVMERAATPAKPRPAAAAKKGFSDYFNKFLQEMDISETCMWLADFNLHEARRLYYEEDFEVVEALSVTRLGYERERARLQFEGPLFGFGGGYQGRSGRDEGEVRVHDMSQLKTMTAAEAAQKLSQMGRRH